MDRGAWRAVVHGITEESDTTEWARILSCQLFQLLLSSPTVYLILASLEGLESPGSNQSTCLPTPFPGRIPKVRPLSHNFLGPFPFHSLPENLGSWHSSLLGLQVILETMPLFVGRWHYIHASIVSQSFSLLEIFIVSLLNNLYFVFSLVFSLPVPSTAIPFYFFFSYSILIKIILSILPKIWHKILWKKETPQLVPFFTNHHF